VCSERALESVNGRSCTRAAGCPGLRIATDWRVFAIGKAASAMTLGALDCLGPAGHRSAGDLEDRHFDPGLERAGRRTCLASGTPATR